MTERIKIALVRVLAALSVLTIGMVVNTIFDYYNQDAIAYNVFTISWSLSLFLIVHSLLGIAKTNKAIYRAFMMFLCLSFTNLCNAITFATTSIYLPSIWFCVGVIFYSIVLINEALIKSKK